MSKERQPTPPSSAGGGTPAACTTGTCPYACRLVSLTVISNATQTHVTGAKNWATAKNASGDVLVQATTDPDNETCWNQINWSGDSGSPVPGHPNQRNLSRANSQKFRVEAELGGIRDHVEVWILWATVTINVSGNTPAHAAQFGARYDGTEVLGARSYNGGNSAVGKVVPEAALSPAGVNAVVQSGWDFKREQISHAWADGVRTTDPRFWQASWSDDTSSPSFQRLTPDAQDKIYDRDAPNIGAFGTDNYETYSNFREWIEWNGDTCSDREGWHWRARWQRTASPQVVLKEVGTGLITLPTTPHFSP